MGDAAAFFVFSLPRSVVQKMIFLDFMRVILMLVMHEWQYLCRDNSCACRQRVACFNDLADGYGDLSAVRNSTKLATKGFCLPDDQPAEADGHLSTCNLQPSTIPLPAPVPRVPFRA